MNISTLIFSILNPSQEDLGIYLFVMMIVMIIAIFSMVGTAIWRTVLQNKTDKIFRENLKVGDACGSGWKVTKIDGENVTMEKTVAKSGVLPS